MIIFKGLLIINDFYFDVRFRKCPNMNDIDFASELISGDYVDKHQSCALHSLHVFVYLSTHLDISLNTKKKMSIQLNCSCVCSATILSKSSNEILTLLLVKSQASVGAKKFDTQFGSFIFGGEFWFPTKLFSSHFEIKNFLIATNQNIVYFMAGK